MGLVDFINSLKSRDAALVYFWLRDQIGGAGRVETTSFEKIAVKLNAANLVTSRGAAFTAAVVRSKFKELETVGVVDREEVDGATFNIYVFNPIPGYAPAAEPVEEPKPDPYGGRRLFDFHFENENENENRNGIEKAENARAHNKENILINKKINNPEGEEKTNPPTSSAVGATPPPTHDAPTPEEATRRVNWDDDAVKATRREIASIVWEHEINPEIIDRLTAACVLGIGGIDKRRVIRIAKNAVSERDLYVSSNGRAGKSHVWKALGYSVKRIYDAGGYAWTPTRTGIEPSPYQRPAPNARPQQSPAPETPPQRVYTPADAEGFTVDDLNLDYADFALEVKKRLHTRYGVDTHIRAAKIRDALRGLKLASEMEAAPAP